MSTIGGSTLQPAQRPILITGCCGFIGSNLADALATRGDRVIAFDALARNGSRENASWLKSRWGRRVEVVIGDVRDASALRSVVIDCAAVLHLAAQVAVTTSLDDPVSDFTSNALGTLNVLEAVRRHNSSAPVLFASTNKVYGKGVADHHFVRRAERYEPREHRLAKGVSEQSPLDLYSPYGCSKGAADQYVHDYARVFGLRSVVMRMSCIYGPRQFGTEDQGWLAHFLMQALRGEPITIYGDGCQVRDALFVDDAVNAWITTLDRIEHVAGRVFNLGGGPANAISLLEAIDRITHLHGRRPDIRFKDWRHGDQLWYVSDIRAIATALDWAPRVSLDNGLRQLDRWICERIPDQAPAPRLQEAGA